MRAERRTESKMKRERKTGQELMGIEREKKGERAGVARSPYATQAGNGCRGWCKPLLGSWKEPRRIS